MSGNIKKEPGLTAKEFKYEPSFIAKKIKKEPGLMLKEIKKEPGYVVPDVKPEPGFAARQIKREPDASDGTPKSKKRKLNVSRCKPKRKKKRAKPKKKNSKYVKKSSKATKPESFEECSLSKSRKKRTVKKRCERKRRILGSKKSNKQAKTLLDQQNNGRLRLFGFKDELEYFSSESDGEEFKQTTSEKSISGKRTGLTSLSARKNLIHSLKSAYVNPFSKPKSVTEPREGANVDLLGSILKSQSLWHSKDPLIKVNENGKVEVITREKNLKKIAGDKKLNHHKSKTNNVALTQASNDPNCTLPTPVEVIPDVNVKDNTQTTVGNINIKAEPPSTAEAWDAEMIVDNIKEEPCEKKIKIELKEEINDVTESPPSVSSLQEYSFGSQDIVDSSSMVNTLDEDDDCIVLSTCYGASSKQSSQRYKERQWEFLPRQDIQIIKIEESEKTKVKENIYVKKEKDRKLKRERETSRRPSPKRREVIEIM